MERFEFRKLASSMTINIGLTKSMGLTGISDDTNDFVENTKINLINPTTDSEYVRFKYKGSNFDLIPNFKGIDQSYSNSLTNALFSDNEVNNRNQVVTNSYFITEVYDLDDNNNQTLLSSNKMDLFTKSGYTYNKVSSSNTVVKLPYISPNKFFLEFSNIYVPNNYIQDVKNVLYIKFRFFNSKLGGVSDFFYSSSTRNIVDTDFYFKLDLNVVDCTYSFNNIVNIATGSKLNIYENKNVNLTRKNNEQNPQNPLVADKNITNYILGYGENG